MGEAKFTEGVVLWLLAEDIYMKYTYICNCRQRATSYLSELPPDSLQSAVAAPLVHLDAADLELHVGAHLRLVVGGGGEGVEGLAHLLDDDLAEGGRGHPRVDQDEDVVAGGVCHFPTCGHYLGYLQSSNSSK